MAVSSKAKLPKWSTPQRQAHLLELWAKYGNRCLLGHTACPIREHYIVTESKVLLVPQAKTIPCVDASGNPIKDKNGNQLTITLYPLNKVIIERSRIDRLYDSKAEALIKYWQVDDRQQSRAEWFAELKALHDLGEQRYPILGRFNAIGKEIFFGSQPLYYIQGLGISGTTLKPFAKVRLPSSYMRLYVDLGDSLRGVSKNRRRKAIRYSKPLSQSIENRINQLVGKAVRHYNDH